MYPPSMAGPARSRNDTVKSDRRFSEVYFGYASNLSPLTLKGRCPDSLFAGLARLEGWRFQINSTGYGNIVPSSPSLAEHEKGNEDKGEKSDHVIGAVFFLSPRDEAGLDESEGVPWLYQKQWLNVQRIGSDGAVLEGGEVKCMTYVDVERTEDGEIMPDYTVWIYKAIRDARPYGLGEGYVKGSLRKWLPRGGDGDDEEREIEAVRVMSPRGAGMAV